MPVAVVGFDALAHRIAAFGLQRLEGPAIGAAQA
jgi:hypothetical protein